MRGVYTALITPFKESKIDDVGLSELIEWQIDQGVHGLVVCGTTGESATLTTAEYKGVLKLCLDTTKRRVPVIAGTGSNSTAKTIEKTSYAQSIGADAALIVAPYYNKPTQEGLYQHFRTVHDATNIPIIIYNVPGRCGVDINDATLARIIQLNRVIGLKDATGDLNRPLNLRQLIDKEIFLFSGEDSTALLFNIHGGCGCISVAANVLPKHCAELQNLFFAQRFLECMDLNDKLFPLNKALFCETNPVPVKYAVSLVRHNISPSVRLPLVKLDRNNQLLVETILSEFI